MRLMRRAFFRFVGILLASIVAFGFSSCNTTSPIRPEQELSTSSELPQQPVEYVLEIKELYWERSISVEKKKQYFASGWTLPEDVEFRYSQQEIYDYEKVLDQEIVETSRSYGHDKVVGSKKIYKNVPIYKEKFYYKYSAWEYERTLFASGSNNEPYWPETKKLSSDERVSSEKEERYFIKGTLNEEPDIIEVPIEYSKWTQFNVGQKINILIPTFGPITISE